MQYKSNKQAFIIAGLVILLCLVSLTGATWALFSSDLKNGTIGVVTTAGNVEVDIVDTSDESLQDKALAFVTTSGAQTNSGNVLFEPGAAFYTQGFQVKNAGNIPINFSMTLSKNDDVDIDSFNRAFEVRVVKEGQDLSDAVLLSDFQGYYLEAGARTETYYLYIKMVESADNEFNGAYYSGIGITVYAVQGNVALEDH